MEKEYIVREDIHKIIIAILVYLSFIFGLGLIIVFRDIPFWGVVGIGVLGILLSLVVISNIRKLIHRKPMYRICEAGIYDVTREHDTLFLSWQDIMKVEMIGNNTSLQIGILASKTLEEKEEMSRHLKENLRENGNRVFYSIMLDGFQFGKQHFQQIYQMIKAFAQQGNANIVFIDYEDPLMKRRKKKKHVKGII